MVWVSKRCQTDVFQFIPPQVTQSVRSYWGWFLSKSCLCLSLDRGMDQFAFSSINLASGCSFRGGIPSKGSSVILRATLWASSSDLMRGSESEKPPTVSHTITFSQWCTKRKSFSPSQPKTQFGLKVRDVKISAFKCRKTKRSLMQSRTLIILNASDNLHTQTNQVILFKPTVCVNFSLLSMALKLLYPPSCHYNFQGSSRRAGRKLVNVTTCE